MSLCVVLLAAGKGKRMKSSLPKVLHPLQRKPLLFHVLEHTLFLSPSLVLIVVGYKKEEVKKALLSYPFPPQIPWKTITQEPQLGTAHALLSTEGAIPPSIKWILVSMGDMPLIKEKTFQEALQKAQKEKADLLFISTIMPQPKGYGRVLRSPQGKVIGIREEKDASEEEKKIREVNTGVFILRNTPFLWEALKKISNHNAQKEYYLPDLIPIYLQEGKKVEAFLKENWKEFSGVNTQEELSSLEKCLTEN